MLGSCQADVLCDSLICSPVGDLGLRIQADEKARPSRVEYEGIAYSHVHTSTDTERDTWPKDSLCAASGWSKSEATEPTCSPEWLVTGARRFAQSS